MEVEMELADEMNNKYLDEEYFTTKFALVRSISITMPSEAEEFSLDNIVIPDTAKTSDEEHNLQESKPNFVDEIVKSSNCISRLEKRIEDKSKMLEDLETAIKVLFTQNMILQKQILLSHDYTCDYMVEDLNSVGRLMGRLNKPVGKARAEAEAALWEKESEKTYAIMNNLKVYLSKTIREVFLCKYENLRMVPMFTILVSDNTSILHRQFFDHFSDLYIRGKVHEDFIKSLHDSISQSQSDVHRKFRQLTEMANNMFHSIMHENRLTYEFNSGSEDEVENFNGGEENQDN